MNLEKRLELMKKNYVPGYRTKLDDLEAYAQLVVLKKKSHPESKCTSYLESIQECHDWLQEKYKNIDFNELEQEIVNRDDERAFKTLFKAKDLLKKLSVAVDAFARLCGQEIRLTDKKVEYRGLRKWCYELKSADNYFGVTYKRRIENLEEEIKSIKNLKNNKN